MRISCTYKCVYVFIWREKDRYRYTYIYVYLETIKQSRKTEREKKSYYCLSMINDKWCLHVLAMSRESKLYNPCDNDISYQPLGENMHNKLWCVFRATSQKNILQLQESFALFVPVENRSVI